MLFSDSANWEILKNFWTISESKSFSEAAIKLDLAQRTLRTHVSKLEEQVGKSLFIKSDKNYMSTTLTPDGENFKKRIKQIKSILDDSEKSINYDGNNEEKEKLFIYTTQGLACTLVPHMIHIFWKKHPNIEVFIKTTDFPKKMGTGEVQIRNNFWAQKNLEKVHLFNLESSFYASKEYIKKNGKPSYLHELKAHNIFFIPSSVESIHCLQKNYYITPHLISNNFQLSLYLCKKGHGILSAPNFLTLNEDLENVLEEEKIPIQEIFAGWINDGNEDSISQKFISSQKETSIESIIKDLYKK